MGKAVDRTGLRYGLLVVVKATERRDKSGGIVWACRCDCGVECAVSGARLNNGDTRSCGCLKDSGLRQRKPRLTHGYSNTKVYRAWAAMKARCYNPSVRNYEEYGGRGIKVCDRWRSSFENFLDDMGEPRPGQSLDRIDNAEHYTPGNCRWATPKVQVRNRRITRMITYQGDTMTFGRLVKLTGADYFNLYARVYRYGWSAERAVHRTIGYLPDVSRR